MKAFIILSALLATAAAASFQAFDAKPMDILPYGDLKPESRIIGGEKAQEGQIPYQVGLTLVNSTGSSAWCGGSLISDEWVLTAAHCVYEREWAIVFLGATSRTLYKQQIISTELYFHPKYNPSTSANDIALIKLPVKASITEYVQPVVLPRLTGSYSTYEGQTVITSGWGRTSDNATSVSEDLFYIFRTVSPNSDCAIVFGWTLVLDTNICMGTVDGNNKKSTCNGDSGGPLVVNDYARTQIGLTSYGAAAGCEKGYPAVFTRVTSYLQWIKDTSGVFA